VADPADLTVTVPPGGLAHPGTPLLPELPYLPGDRIAGRYEVLELLGRGGAGAVLRVKDHQGGSIRALKLHAPRRRPGHPPPPGPSPAAGADSDGWSWRLRREFYVLAQLRHPNIVRVHEWGEDRGFLYYTMDPIAGRDAADLGHLAPEQVIDLLVAITSALGLIHARGFVHQDIKPRNIRVPDGASGDRPLLGALLMDFGLIAPAATDHGDRVTTVELEHDLPVSHTGDEKSSRTRRVAGTAGFIAPEVLLGAPADGRSDLYAVGVTAHLLLTGQLPPHAGAVGLAGRMEQVPPGLAQLVGELLAADPRRRPADAAELAERLAALAPGTDRQEASAAHLAPSYLAAPRLVGREPEMAALRRAWGRASEGQGGPVYLVGAPGMGKSRVMEAFALEMRISGARVLQAAAELRQSTPFAAVRQLLRQAGAAGPPLLEAAAAVLSERLPPSDSPAVQLRAVKQAVAAWAAATAARQPTVLMVDDLFWCDEGSIAVIEHLANEAHRLPLLVVCSLRPDAGAEADASAQLERLRRGALEVLELGALDPGGVHALLHGIFGPVEVHELLLEQWHRACGGVPYLGVEIARELHERGIIRFEAGRWRLPRTLDGVALPGSLDEALHDRLARLGPAARRLAQVAAVAGSPVELSLLQAISDIGEASLFAALDELGERLVARIHQGQLRFLHARLEEVLYQETPAADRATFHRRTGELLQRRWERSGERSAERASLGRAIGHHLSRGGPEVDQQAVRWLKEAGDQAYETGAFGDAMGPLREAARLLEREVAASGPARPELLAIWERLAMSSYLYDIELAVATFEKLRHGLDRTGHWSTVRERNSKMGARAAVLGGLVRSTTGRLMVGLRDRLQGILAGQPGVGMLAALRHAVNGAVAEVASYALCTSYLGIARMLLGDFAASAQLVEELYRFCDAQGGSTVTFAHSARAALALGRGRFAEALHCVRLSEEALDSDRGELPAAELRRARAMVSAQSGWVLALTGNADTRGLLERSVQLAQEADEAFVLHALAVPAVYHADRGELTFMLRARARFLEQCSRLRVAWHESLVYPTTTRLLIQAGLYSRARDDLAAFEAVTPQSPFREGWVNILGGLLDVTTGDLDRGLRRLDQAARLATSPQVDAVGWATEAMLGIAEGYLRGAQADRAASLARVILERLQPPEIGYAWGATRAHRMLARAHLQQGQLPAAQLEVERASHTAAPLDNPGEAAHLQLLRAELLVASGEVKAAWVHAHGAELAFHALGNGFWARRAAELGPTAGSRGASETGGPTDTLVDATETVTKRDLG
jgi:hypothetical protein